MYQSVSKFNTKKIFGEKQRKAEKQRNEERRKRNRERGGRRGKKGDARVEAERADVLACSLHSIFPPNTESKTTLLQQHTRRRSEQDLCCSPRFIEEKGRESCKSKAGPEADYFERTGGYDRVDRCVREGARVG